MRGLVTLQKPGALWPLPVTGEMCRVQGAWQVREEPIGAAKERAIGYACLEPGLLGAEREYCDWANTDLIGYSWFKDDQFAAPKDLPFFDAVVSRPQK